MKLALPIFLVLAACRPSPPPIAPPVPPPRLAFAEDVLPEGPAWPTATPAEAGWNETLLEEALALLGDAHTTEFLLCYQGRILVERTWSVDAGDLDKKTGRAFSATLAGETADGRGLEDVTSVMKSVAALLVARARDEGLLSFDDPVSAHVGAGWTRDAETEDAITVRHVLSMTTGLTADGKERWAPGSRWRYEPAHSYWLLPVLETVTGRTRDDLLRDWLAEPIGLADTHWRQHPEEHSVGLVTSARDLARLGLLIQNGGRWNGREVVREASLDELFARSQQHNPGYGLSWWLNNEGILHHDEALRGRRALPHAPPDLVMALGWMDKQLCASPSEHIVTVRLGAKLPGAGSQLHDDVWKLLMRARPTATD